VQPLLRTVRITNPDNVFIDLGIPQAMRMRHVVICVSPGCTFFSPHIPHKWDDFRKTLLNIKRVLILL